ncbi:hypothetical protein LNAOJCKE_3005 [Methylorubrum aminovorans]|uniref:Uncharacterized protein n=1 Tax=Methylorubrum aminovorans TaxID=269069 RepID=A0ABQ4UF93_9HYPH|nr:hypothetical protein LNAOJCKE_3005 [Methylorubrum aminovorans]
MVGPIGSSGSEVRKHSDMVLHAIIKEVIDSLDLSYEVRRADDDVRPGMIGDRIIHDIINSDLVIADLTGLNPNVFYELGIRHAVGRPTIHIAKIGTVLPFDNSGHDTLFVDVTDWQDIVRTRGRLSASIRAINDPNYRVSNPITQSNASYALKSSEDPRDIVLAEVNDRLSALETKQLAGPWKQRGRRTHVNSDRLIDEFIEMFMSRIKNVEAENEKVSLAFNYGELLGLDIANVRIKGDKLQFNASGRLISIALDGTEASILFDDDGTASVRMERR